MQKLKSKIPLESGRILFLPVDLIRPNPGQPRKVFDRNELQELADSILRHGMLQPICVRRQSGGYELIAGERRLRAAKLAGLEQVPCILMAMSEEQSGLAALVENLQRKDLDYIEQAEGIARLMRIYGLNQEQTAERLGMSQSAVANKLRILKHSPGVLAALREARLSERHARALLRLPTAEDRLEAIRIIAAKEWNVAKTEAYVDAALAKAARPRQGMRKFILKDVRLFLNSVDHHLQTMRNAGITADSTREETENEIILTIRLPKRMG